jgi:hypothetical protein
MWRTGKAREELGTRVDYWIAHFPLGVQVHLFPVLLVDKCDGYIFGTGRKVGVVMGDLFCGL